MARGAAGARCRVPDPLRIDSHTVPSQRTCHVGWRRTREVRRKLRVVRPPRPPPLPPRPLLPAPHRIAGRHHWPGGAREPSPRVETQPGRPRRGGASHWRHHLEASIQATKKLTLLPNAWPLRRLHGTFLSFKIIADQLGNRLLPWWAQSYWILEFHSFESIHSPISTSLSGTPSQGPAPTRDQACIIASASCQRGNRVCSQVHPRRAQSTTEKESE